ncbi:MAG: SGNH/GDSL hydrolase family protein [Bacteroidota bacterium]
MRYLILTVFSLLFMPTDSFTQDWPNLQRFQAANDALGNPTEDETRVVFMGNSITEGWLQDSLTLFDNPAYINRGIGGQTTPQMLIRFRQDVIDLQPKAVVILAGINDIAGNTGPSSLEMITDNIFSMAELAETNGIQVILCSVLPALHFPWRPGLEPANEVIKLNRLLQAYATQREHAYVDYFKAMVDENNGLQKALTYDGVHPNITGYRVMEPLVLDAIQKMLAPEK